MWAGSVLKSWPRPISRFVQTNWKGERKKNGSLIKALIRIIMLLQEVGASCNCTLVQTNMLLGFRQCYDQLCGSENSEGEALALG